MILITGDIHGSIDIKRLASARIKRILPDLTKDDYLIIAGDFGLVWSNEQTKEEKYWLDWLEDKPWTTLFVDGNHENHAKLNSFPVETWHGGKVHKIRPSIIHLMRGQIFEIEGKKFFTFGGALSHDIQDGILVPEAFSSKEEFKKEYIRMTKANKFFRVQGESWWPEELPSAEEIAEGWKNLAAADYKIDYIISHCASTSTQIIMGGRGLYEADILTDFFQEIEEKVEFTRHYFGHYHLDKVINDKQVVLYNTVMEVI